MNFFFTIFLLFALFIQSCNTHKSGTVKVERSKNISIPVKILIHETNKDSSLTRLFIPVEFDITNTFSPRIKLSDGYLSLRGGNVQSGSIDLLTDNKLDLAFNNIKFNKNEKKHFKAYTSYKLILSNHEKDEILKDAKFAQYMFTSKKEVYDIGSLKKTPPFLLKKVPDSLKGFIRMHFYDLARRKRFAENLPVKF